MSTRTIWVDRFGVRTGRRDEIVAMVRVWQRGRADWCFEVWWVATLTSPSPSRPVRPARELYPTAVGPRGRAMWRRQAFTLARQAVVRHSPT